MASRPPRRLPKHLLPHRFEKMCLLTSVTSCAMDRRPIVLTGCGFGFWWAWGYLHSKQTRTITAVSGSALAAACHLCDLHVTRQIEVCDKLRPSCGGIFAMAKIVRRWLETQLPFDAHRRCSGRLRVLTRTLPRFRIVEHTQWQCRADLIDVLVAASCPLRWTLVNDAWHTDCMLCTRVSGHWTVNPPMIYFPPTRVHATDLFNRGVYAAKRE